ncbi:MAG: ABC-type multidrug transport system ATPase [Planctomycetota bacterium]|nr:MAG: ABC-type multidrug transport system ATPase [Planctomycetota bacterium]
MAAIVAQALTKHYKDTVAVNAISFEVREGECFGFLGPNGAGKTTTMKMTYGFSPVTSGRLEVFGLDVLTRSREVRAQTGVCPQEDNLDPDFTVRKNLIVYCRYFGIDPVEAAKRADELLDFVALREKAGGPVMALSGGMKRRLVLARALLNKPKLLILDEPTTGLDPQARHVLWDKIRELRRKGVTILLTTHYMEEAAQLCDRLVIMDKAKILVKGSPAELTAKHARPTVVEVWNPPAAAEAWIKARNMPCERFGDRLYVYPDAGEALQRELVTKFNADQVIVRRGTLEDVFLRLTGRDLRE